jgi:long-chain acyl-CoA synthetase
MDERSIPEQFFRLAKEHPARALFRVKEGGAWRDRSWDEVAAAAREIGHGLISLGLNAGDKVAILSDNRLDWIYTDLGILAAGGVTVTIYPSNLSHEIEYIVNHSGSRFLALSDQKQFDKVRDRKETMPGLETVISFDPLAAEVPDVLTLAALRQRGRAHLQEQPHALDERIAALEPQDLCTMVYTSGTTGPPKGAMISHGNFLFVHHAVNQVLQLDKDRDMPLSILPYAHVYERIGGLYNSILSGLTISICEGLDKIAANVAEVRPTMILGAPRLYEKMYAGIRKNIAAQPPLKRRLFEWAQNAGRQASPYKISGRPMPLGLKLKYAAADALVFKTIKQKFGGRIRFFVSAAAPISKEIIEFFDTLDILIIEGWGMTETSAPSTINVPGAIKFGSVGRALPGVELKIADDGEIMVRGPNLFMGYFDKEGVIREGFEPDGWFHTGDIGRIDEDGYLYITDRKKDLIITAGGKNIAPQNLENLLKNDLYISEALVYGDRQKFLSAIVTLDEEATIDWARKEGIAFTVFADLSQKEEVKKLIESRIAVFNRNLPRHETIKKIRILDRQFLQELGEITPTMKLKRKALYQKFGPQFAEMYSGLEDGDF